MVTKGWPTAACLLCLEIHDAISVLMLWTMLCQALKLWASAPSLCFLKSQPSVTSYAPVNSVPAGHMLTGPRTPAFRFSSLYFAISKRF